MQPSNLPFLFKSDNLGRMANASKYVGFLIYYVQCYIGSFIVIQKCQVLILSCIHTISIAHPAVHSNSHLSDFSLLVLLSLIVRIRLKRSLKR
jgi:hypothetical protein